MKPYKNFIFFLSILLVLAVISGVFGGKVYTWTERWQVKIPVLDMPFGKAEEPVTEEVLEIPEEPKVPVMTQAEMEAFLAVDASVLDYSELQDLPYFPFVYADSIEHPLIPFFEHLTAMTDTSELVRILHYGDSQIETDRITSTIRHYLQTSFGGSGMGAVPLFSPANISTFVVKKSVNWTKNYVTDDNAETHALSATMGYLQGSAEDMATINLHVSPYLQYSEAGDLSNIRILVSDIQNPEGIEVLDNEKMNYPFTNQDIGNHFSMIRIPVDTTKKEFEINFQKANNTYLYGISVDSKYGLAVDNIPVRGSAGYIFARQKAALLQESFQILNTKLVLFQFGINAIPNDPKIPVNAKALENALVRELGFFKSLMPDVPLVVIGVSDRAYKNGDIFETNPNVLVVRNAQKNAAFRTGCVFWDLFEAMGGQNSMVDWVNQKPALAAKDYTHFLIRGAQRVGEIFYKSLMMDYLNYLKQQKEAALQEKLQALDETY